LLASSDFERFTYCVEVAMEHPIRLFRSLTVALVGADVFATAGFVGTTAPGRVTASASASMLFSDAAFLEPPDPDPTMPLPRADEPAIDGPSLPPTSHHRHHRPSWHPRA
jgi:hypothetical protein